MKMDAHVKAYLWYIRVQEDLEMERNNLLFEEQVKSTRNWPFSN
jgi:hypothetical protein